MIKTKKRLHLDATTVRNLTAGNLVAVSGGVRSDVCPSALVSNCPLCDPRPSL